MSSTKTFHSIPGIGNLPIDLTKEDIAAAILIGVYATTVEYMSTREGHGCSQEKSKASIGESICITQGPQHCITMAVKRGTTTCTTEVEVALNASNEACSRHSYLLSATVGVQRTTREGTKDCCCCQLLVDYVFIIK